MITSLFKIVGLSLLSICPFHSIADSSINELGLSAIQVDSSDLNKKLGYYNVVDNVIRINQSDFDNGYYDNFTYDNTVVSNVNWGISAYWNETDEEYDYNFITYQFKDGVLIGKTNTTSVSQHTYYQIFHIDFTNKVIYSDNYRDGTIFTNRYFEWAEFSYESVNGYSTFFNELKSYIKESTKLTFSSSVLNTVVFTNFANYMYQNIDTNFADSFIRADYGSHLDCGSFIQDNIFITGDDNPNNIDFYLNGSYKGYWFIDSAIKQFNYSLYLYINDFDIYNGLLNAFNLDITSDMNLDYVGSFTFAYKFNYNAPYNANLDTHIIRDSYFDSASGDEYLNKDIYTHWFESNGKSYNLVRLKYVNAWARWFSVDSDNDGITDSFKQLTIHGYGYFESMSFVNTADNDSVVVYSRNHNTSIGNDSTTNYITSDGSWVNSEYRFLYFNSLTNIYLINDLTNLNNNNSINSIIEGSNFDFKSTFGFINIGLNGLASFLNIQILPNITIGMLILVPFAVSMLLFVIKLFKR